MTKFLIIRFSSIGDIVLTTPVIRCLKTQVRDIELHYCSKKQYALILQHNNYIDKLHVLESSFQDFTERLKKERFDYIIDLHNSLRSRRLKLAIGVPSYTFKKINFKKWLMVHWKVNHLPANHIVDRYLQTLTHWKVTNDMQGLDYFYPSKDEIKQESLPEPFNQGYVAFAMGARHYTKQPPLDLIVSICRQLHYPVILLGGPEDKVKAEFVVSQLPGKAMNLCGNISLNQSASVVKNARAIITPDTGLMHIAAAFKKVIISLWGNTIPAFGMSPYLPDPRSRIFEINDLKCRPCSKLGFEKCPKGHFHCMTRMPAVEIANYVNSVTVNQDVPR